MTDIFGVIADAKRRDILELLHTKKDETNTGISVTEIVNTLEITQPTVSKHLRVLREAELVTVTEEGQHRLYTINPEPLHLIEDFLLPLISNNYESSYTIEYLNEDGTGIRSDLDVAAENLGRTAGDAARRVKQLVARFVLRD